MTNRLTYDYVTKHFPQTDKATFGFLPAYNGFLPDEPGKVLEIGCWKGDGMRTIRHFYNGEGEYHLMNYVYGDSDGHIPSIEDFEKEGFICHTAYDDNIEQMSKITDQFDVIIEDASHCSDSQIICFKQMFLNNLKRNGVYFIEDLHCCPSPPFWRNITRFEDTILHLFREVIKGGTFESFLFTKEEDELIRSQIKEITITGGITHGIMGIVNK
jgi:hypothetical protein